MDRRKIQDIVRRVNKGRVVFFGPEWGVVVLTVVNGKIKRVNSTWGDGPSELDRVVQWGDVKYTVKEEDAPKENSRLGTKPSDEKHLMRAPVLPPGFVQNLERVFRITLKQHSIHEWVSIEQVISDLAKEKKKLLLVAEAETGHRAVLLFNNTVFEGGVYRTPEDTHYNTAGLDKLRQDNMLLPFEVKIRMAEFDHPGLESVFLPFKRNASFTDYWKDTVEVAKVMKAYRLCLLLTQEVLVGRGPDMVFHDLISGQPVNNILDMAPEQAESWLFVDKPSPRDSRL